MGEYLSSPKRDKDSSEGSNQQLKYGASGMQGWRKGMEDSHVTHLDVIEGEVSVFGVFDGHGGSEVAHFVSNHLVDELRKNENFRKALYKQALIEVFIGLDKMLLTEAGKKELQAISRKHGSMASGAHFDGADLAVQAGCTCCVALVTKTEIYVANAGDTRCVIAINGAAKDLSIDHKPDLPSEKRRILKGGGFVEEGRVNGVISLSRAIGDWEYKNPSLKPEDNVVSAYPEVMVEVIKPEHDFMIVACDGIWDCLTSQQAVDYIYEQKGKLQKKLSQTPSLSTQSSTKSNGATSSSIAAGKKSSTAVTSTGKKSPTKKGTGDGSPSIRGSQQVTGFGIARAIEMMLDKICPINIATSEGVGTDNMTCMVIEFNKQAPTTDQ